MMDRRECKYCGQTYSDKVGLMYINNGKWICTDCIEKLYDLVLLPQTNQKENGGY